MSETLNDRLEHRAAVHAALADSSRLRIVDLLTLGDVSPGDLQSVLRMPSNLIAHHLKVLEGAGIVCRRRSEADGRRSYVRLVPDALDDIAPRAATSARRVVFVCTANSARSQLAAALWKGASDIPVASAGTHPADRVAPGAVAVANRHRLALDDVSPRRLDEVLSRDDLVITVCDRAHEELGDTGGPHWSVPDPVPRGTDAAFDAAFAELAARIDDLAPRTTAA